MNRNRLGLIAAMPEEIKPLLRTVKAFTSAQEDSFPLYRFDLAGNDITLIESGIGPRRAAAACKSLVKAASPALILNFGFAGAFTPGIRVGDIVVARRLLQFHDRLFSEQKGLSAMLAELTAKELRELPESEHYRVYLGAFITAAQILGKKQALSLIPSGIEYPALEMESSAIAQVCAASGIPLIAIRAISDGAEEELGFSMHEFTDKEMNLKIWKVLLTVARKPWIIPQLLRLGKNSKIAGRSLAKALTKLLNSPDLLTLALPVGNGRPGIIP